MSKVYTKLEYGWTEGKPELVHEEGFDYEGPVALCGGGPSQQQKDAATAEANLANTQAKNADAAQQIVQSQYSKINPFATSRMNTGLPFYKSLTDYAGGTNAAAYAPAQAGLRRQLSSYGSLPSGFKQQSLTDFDAARARGFDQDMTQNLFANDQAKTNAAGLLVGQQEVANPLGWSSTASSSNNSIMQAPLATPGIGSVISGLGGALIGKMGKLPF